jgi:hypothetical protein
LVVPPDTRAGGTDRAAEGGSRCGDQREGECAAGRSLSLSGIAVLHYTDLNLFGYGLSVRFQEHIYRLPSSVINW